MPSDLVIRRESPDQPAVVALLVVLDEYLARLYPPEANHVLDARSLRAPEVRFFVARQGTQLAGTGAVRLMPGEAATAGEPYGEIKRMMVDAAQRGQRIGVALLLALEQALRAENVTLALLETGRDQHEAVRLYERCGYRPRDAFGGYPDKGLSLFLGKRL